EEGEAWHVVSTEKAASLEAARAWRPVARPVERAKPGLQTSPRVWLPQKPATTANLWEPQQNSGEEDHSPARNTSRGASRPPARLFLDLHIFLGPDHVFLGRRVLDRQLGSAEVGGVDLALLTQAVVGRLDRGEVGGMAVDHDAHTQRRQTGVVAQVRV